jgi:hypothetical protein
VKALKELFILQVSLWSISSNTIATPQLLNQLLNHGISSVKTSINIHHQAYCQNKRSLQKKKKKKKKKSEGIGVVWVCT